MSISSSMAKLVANSMICLKWWPNFCLRLPTLCRWYLIITTTPVRPSFKENFLIWWRQPEFYSNGQILFL
jgi:hypothetical protein